MGIHILTALLLTLVAVVPTEIFGAPRSPASVTAKDKPNDRGGVIIVSWKDTPSDVARYEILRIGPDGERAEVGTNPPGDLKYTDSGSAKAPIRDGVPYRYIVKTIYVGGKSAESEPSAPVIAEASWFHTGRWANFIAVLFFSALFFVLVRRGRKGKTSYIRPIAGIEALGDAVGRAAEMGRPILYVPGLHAASQPATVASMSILSDVTQRAARLRTKVRVPNYSPLTWPVSQNVMREAFLKAGRPEDFDPSDSMYLTSRSFTYSAAVVGMMTREKTASHLLVGHFFSESLLLAETGAATGAMQIGATDSETQLPFFITTCDYTMIGEELFAAAAEVAGDPVNRSTIAAHDWFKALAMVLIIAGFVLGILDAAGIEGAGDLAQKLAGLLKEGK
ncbi:MAG: fibronectin type III domain-containing protein [Deltaproteobacteria bacterium]|nr:fibronectin type III domain-containing protein [Deltaproteobacteria bacterium]